MNRATIRYFRSLIVFLFNVAAFLLMIFTSCDKNDGDDINNVVNQGPWLIHMESPSQAGLTAVWGSGPNDVFAVGLCSTIIRYNGS